MSEASAPPGGDARSADQRRSKALRWAVGIGAAAIIGVGLVLLFLLAQATNNRELYERNYARLFALNVVVAVVLLAVILWAVVRLIVRVRRGRFGSRLLVKLAAIFALVGLVPGLVIYVVSYQFVSRSIESWFDVKVEGALDAGVNLGRTTLEVLANDLGNKTRQASALLADVPDAAVGLSLERIRDQLSATDVVLWSSSGQLIASAGQSSFQLNPERLSAQQLRAVRAQRVLAQVEGLDEIVPGVAPQGRVKALAVVPSASVGLLAEPRFLQATQPLPQVLVDNALAVQEAHREYQERALARNGLQRMYIGTLTLSLFLAVFGAVLLAVLLGNQLARPLLLLAHGVRQVAAGDLTPKAVLQSRDELAGLTRSFADMTQQLADARFAVDRSMQQLDGARANLQTILDNLSSGVIVLDGQGAIVSSNPGATRILRAPLAAFEDRRLAEVGGLEKFAQSVQAQFDRFDEERDHHGLDHWQQPFELNATQSPFSQDAIMLLARGARLPDHTRLLVFDDISEIVSAQRAQAWGEVARRLAHEIKNPLTPIQLSAERMEMKLASKLGDPERALLTKSVRTIVEQVDAMKRLVNEFRDYARLPAAELKPLDLNALVHNVMQLYPQENAAVRVDLDLDTRCPSVMGDAEQLRQVIHNLLQNAQDATEAANIAHAAQGEAPADAVVLRTQWAEATQRVRLIVLDHGTGFPEPILKRAFEPYVTTKARGTGLGLAVVKKIADEHGTRIDIANRVVDGGVVGAQVSLSFAVNGKA
ncbi:ATP-binding protein [Pseudorhodoferax sp. Leaf267]|uniref:sensor histidine kinase n=1 Tax=Pseudorhodoferax sp. Leaf267 TaxID=1736316 RepID=UPI0006F3E937|nr:ATP-binding protein [Pseudorhodoferax sp. Leaf267]KQP13530.1 PAS domain-containing sensor histidine kinase [Pseudorhodoferax sp. Leaf267]